MNNEKEEEALIGEIASHYEAIIRLIGENPQREGLLKTPLRAARALWYCTRGYREAEEQVVGEALFNHDGSQMVVVRNIEFYSLCEHHILPFFGTISIGYLPQGRIIGISKVARLVELYARRLQVQERLTSEVAKAIERLTGASGVIVTCRGRHLCMAMRGVEKQSSETVTIETTGRLADDPNLQQQFFAMTSN